MSKDELSTVRDYLRYAVSELRRANVAFGHGAADALDEAAFIVLEALYLPIEDINPWLDARLLAPERRRLDDLIRARVEKRMPAAYLLNKAYIQGVPFYVDERVIVPRSFIGEILLGDQTDGLGDLIGRDRETVASVLDLCTGSGCLAILAAMAFPNARVAGVDISADALAVAARNVADHKLEERIELLEGDLFAPLSGRRFDLILANPPYVSAAAMAALPPEYRREPSLALAGGADGVAIVRRIIDGAADFLEPEGGLLCEVGDGRAALENAYPDTEFLWLDTELSCGEVFWLAARDFPG